jgi:hypothetical protein
MLNKNFKIVTIIEFLLMTILSFHCTANTNSKASYRDPSPVQLIKAEQLFTWLFSKESLKKAQKISLELGFEWQETAHSIRLKDKAKIGWGDYRFSKRYVNGIVVMAPHRFHDKHTGVIAKSLFSKHKITSIALNSLPRYSGIERHTFSDLAHIPNSLHTAYSRAFVTQFPNGKLIQLHGFNAQKRRTRAGQLSDIILSTGTRWPSEYLLTLQTCLINKNWKSVRYPQQVSELGATKNSVGRLLRHLGHFGFTHIELNASSRIKLLNNKNTQKAFANCILGVES